MRPAFGEDHEIFRAQVRRFVEREIAPHHAQWEKDGVVPKALWRKAGTAGLLCSMIPEAYGGPGGDYGHTAVLIEELARANASGPGFTVHSDIVAPYILAYGTEEQKHRWLPPMARGEVIGAIAMTEPGVGSDLKAIATRAHRDGDHYVISGQKTYITNGQNCGLVIVVCKTEPAAGAKGVSLICVEDGTPGFARGRNLDKLGMHAQDTSELFFSDVRVPVDNLLGQENRGFAYLMHELTQERLSVAVRAPAMLEAALEKTVAYTRDRKAFGQAIFDHQNTRFTLAGAKAEIAMLRVFVDHCLALHLKRELSPQTAAMAKLVATEMQSRLLDQFLQLHGGAGYMNEYFVGRAWVDARVARIYAGSNEIMKEIISRNL
ncbi:MAG TPA: acyl-CoA dehydrogenase family protein [Vineibacter sp.]|nr:acyl-CoA dehydrogenase family protein [Vineibacter sp.]